MQTISRIDSDKITTKHCTVFTAEESNYIFLVFIAAFSTWRLCQTWVRGVIVRAKGRLPACHPWSYSLGPVLILSGPMCVVIILVRSASINHCNVPYLYRHSIFLSRLSPALLSRPEYYNPEHKSTGRHRVVYPTYYIHHNGEFVLTES